MGVETLDLGHDLKLPRPSKIWVGTSWCKLAGRISQYLGLPVNQPPSAFGRFELEVSREGARASSLVLPGDWKLASGFGNLVTTYPWFDEVKRPFVGGPLTRPGIIVMLDSQLMDPTLSNCGYNRGKPMAFGEMRALG